MSPIARPMVGTGVQHSPVIQGQAQTGKMNYIRYAQHVQQPQQRIPTMSFGLPLQHQPGVANWLENAGQNLRDRIIYEIPGILDHYIPQFLHSENPMLVPQDTWSLRSLSPEQRFDQYRMMVLFGRRLLGHAPISFEYLHAWAAVQTNSRILVREERKWYDSFKQGWATPQQGRTELLRIMGLQTAPIPIGYNPAQQLHSHMAPAPRPHFHGQKVVQ